jgi:hypothetical protein
MASKKTTDDSAPPQAPVSFAKDIQPLFRAVDVGHMKPMGVLLDNYTWMSTPANAQSVYGHLTGTLKPQMPMNAPPWSSANQQLFNTWMTTGYAP